MAKIKMVGGAPCPHNTHARAHAAEAEATPEPEVVEAVAESFEQDYTVAHWYPSGGELEAIETVASI